MSAVSNLNWYALNATRRWPVDDAATGEDDAGAGLGNNVLVDAAVRVPADLCGTVAVSSVTVTPNLVTVTLVGAAAPPAAPASAPAAADPGFVPVGAVSVRQPVVPGRPYPIRPLADGVGGWLVFGDGVDAPARHRFSTAAQAALAPRACRAYRRPPVTSVGKRFSALSLTGVVLLKGGTDVEVVAAEREVEGVARDVIVVRLRSNTPRNLLDLYRGPCGGRPESRTCGRPGVEFLNTVGPDCDGDIRIDFRSPLRPSYYPGGVALDYPYGLIDACTRDDRLPAADGRLPNEYDAACGPTGGSEAAADPDGNAGQDPAETGSEPQPFPPEVSSEVVQPADLPAVLRFDDGWDAVVPTYGDWSLAAADSPGEGLALSSGSSAVPPDGAAYAAESPGRSVALWAGSIGTGSAGVRLTTDVRIDGGLGVAGLALNHRPAAAPDAYQYWAVELSRATSRLQIRRWNGLAWVDLVGAGPVAIAEGEWHRLEAAVEDLGGGTYRVSARAWDPAGVLLASASTDAGDYGPADGYLGLAADRTAAAFSYLRVETYP